MTTSSITAAPGRRRRVDVSEVCSKKVWVTACVFTRHGMEESSIRATALTEPRPSGSGLSRLEPTACLRARLGRATEKTGSRDRQGVPMSLRLDKRSRDRQGAVSPPQESGPGTSLRPTQGNQNPRVSDRAVCRGWNRPLAYARVKKPGTVPSAVHGGDVFLSMTSGRRGGLSQGFFTHPLAHSSAGRLAGERHVGLFAPTH